jgi:hypothetical protein
MANYKKAAQVKLRFTTSKGLLSTEQLMDLGQLELATVIKSLKKVVDESTDDELSFLTDTIKKNSLDELRFEIAKDIYLDKKQRMEDVALESENKRKNQEILAIIAKKEGDKLEDLSIEDLKKMLK